MADASDPGCALRPDGTLKDASEIRWHYDVDDELPMPSASTSSAPSTSSIPADNPKIHPFFTGQPPQGVMIAGSRRSGRAIRPSARILDPDNAMSAANPTSAASSKRKAPASSPLRRVAPRIDTDEDGSETDAAGLSVHPSSEVSEAEDLGEMTDKYEALQAMADTDH
jgi:hypothetical protein